MEQEQEMNTEEQVEQVEQVETDQPPTETSEPQQEQEPVNPVHELLDEISEDSGKEETNEEPVQAAEQPAEPAEPKEPVESQAESQAEQPESVEDLLADVKSERSKQRIRQLIEDNNNVRQQASQIEETNRQFAEIVRNTGMNDAELANTFEFCRLSRQDDEASLNLALEMLEKERQDIYVRLGRTAPGNDALDGFDDLKQAVESMDLTQEKAREIAELRRFKQLVTNRVNQQTASQRQQEQQRQQYQAEIQSFQKQAMNMFEGGQNGGGLKAVDPNYNARIAAVGQWLKQGGQDWMVRNLPPQKWTEYLFNVYQQAPIQPQQRNVSVSKATSPLSGRPQSLSKPAIKGTTPSEIVGSVFDNLGL